MTRKVLIDVPSIHDDGLRVFERIPDIEIVRYDRSTQSLADAIKDVDAVLVGLAIYDEKIINMASNLKILAKHGVGYDNVDVPTATKRKIPVVIAPYANSTTVAEFAVSFMLALAKKLFPTNAVLKDGTFVDRKQVTSNDIWGKTIGVIGIGRIGAEVTRICRLAFHMNVLAYDPYVTDAWAAAAGARRVETLDELLKVSDFVSAHCPLTPETHDLIGEKEIKSMKDSAYLVNTARGGIVNETALLAALDAGWIQGAALDVLESEPPSQDNKLLNHEKVILTPHTAANTDEAMSRMAVMAAEEILKVLDGEKPLNVINPEIYL